MRGRQAGKGGWLRFSRRHFPLVLRFARRTSGGTTLGYPSSRSAPNRELIQRSPVASGECRFLLARPSLGFTLRSQSLLPCRERLVEYQANGPPFEGVPTEPSVLMSGQTRLDVVALPCIY